MQQLDKMRRENGTEVIKQYLNKRGDGSLVDF